MNLVIISPGILKRLVGQKLGDQFFLRESGKALTEAPSNCGFQQGESFEFLMRDWMWMRSFRMAATMAHL